MSHDRLGLGVELGLGPPLPCINLGLNEFQPVGFTRDHSDTRDHYDLCIINKVDDVMFCC